MKLFTKVEKVFHNFYKPAPKDIQRYCAALKGVGGLMMASGLGMMNPWIGGIGLLLSCIGEGWEKLTEDKPVPVSATGEPVESVKDVA